MVASAVCAQLELMAEIGGASPAKVPDTLRGPASGESAWHDVTDKTDRAENGVRLRAELRHT